VVIVGGRRVFTTPRSPHLPFSPRPQALFPFPFGQLCPPHPSPLPFFSPPQFFLFQSPGSASYSDPIFFSASSVSLQSLTGSRASAQPASPQAEPISDAYARLRSSLLSLLVFGAASNTTWVRPLSLLNKERGPTREFPSRIRLSSSHY